MEPNEEIMAVDKRLARLEETVAKGFFEQGGMLRAQTGRFDRLEDRMVALESKMDVVAESIRGDIQAAMAEMRRITASIRAEHAADRQLTREALRDHVTRVRALEDNRQI